MVLTLVRQPRRGVELIGSVRLLGWSIGALVLTAATSILTTIAPLPLDVWLEFAPLGLAAIACGLAMQSSAGRRSALLLAPVYLPTVTSFLVMHTAWGAGTGDQALAMMGMAAAMFLLTSYPTLRHKSPKRAKA
ncbi:hypothetical protein AB0B45_46525 [Nonomuraea sp. NPDC049152]|uniref:hypothetical protein n=1 Tax=Nonomuraea sp. NPDC049152 TaxID=3154350 RepID=UPI00340D4582